MPTRCPRRIYPGCTGKLLLYLAFSCFRALPRESRIGKLEDITTAASAPDISYRTSSAEERELILAVEWPSLGARSHTAQVAPRRSSCAPDAEEARRLISSEELQISAAPTGLDRRRRSDVAGGVINAFSDVIGRSWPAGDSAELATPLRAKQTLRHDRAR